MDMKNLRCAFPCWLFVWEKTHILFVVHVRVVLLLNSQIVSPSHSQIWVCYERGLVSSSLLFVSVLFVRYDVFNNDEYISRIWPPEKEEEGLVQVRAVMFNNLSAKKSSTEAARSTNCLLLPVFFCSEVKTLFVSQRSPRSSQTLERQHTTNPQT